MILTIAAYTPAEIKPVIEKKGILFRKNGN